eukprot:gene7572-biopygen9090
MDRAQSHASENTYFGRVPGWVGGQNGHQQKWSRRTSPVGSSPWPSPGRVNPSRSGRPCGAKGGIWRAPGASSAVSPQTGSACGGAGEAAAAGGRAGRAPERPRSPPIGNTPPAAAETTMDGSSGGWSQNDGQSGGLPQNGFWSTPLPPRVKIPAPFFWPRSARMFGSFVLSLGILILSKPPPILRSRTRGKGQGEPAHGILCLRPRAADGGRALLSSVGG